MFPCCWITALIALLASFGVSFTNWKLGLVVGILALISIMLLIFKKFKGIKSKSCCSKDLGDKGNEEV